MRIYLYLFLSLAEPTEPYASVDPCVLCIAETTELYASAAPCVLDIAETTELQASAAPCVLDHSNSFSTGGSYPSRNHRS